MKFLKENKERLFRLLMWFIIFSVIFSMMQGGPARNGVSSRPYSEFIDMVRDGQVSRVEIDGSTIRAQTPVGVLFETHNPGDPHLVDDLLENQVTIISKPPEQRSLLMEIFISWSPILLLIGVWIYFMRRSQGGGGGMGAGMKLGESKAKLLQEDQIKVTFADVAGCEEAKEEVSEMVDFLRDPSKFERVGGKIPRGALMVGPPGTGKTLLARAVAGEAKVPFFTISGSDFVEMFVGVGASRVRSMFEQAKKAAPCIIFIDEIDAVGRQRGAGLGGGHDEREQTLNQLLVEMDGFDGNDGVIVIAATNRPDILDKALLRPGRFDREITVGLPDVRGREQILKVHMKRVPAADDVELKYIARGTPGFSGADLANLINEAALFCARSDRDKVGMYELEKAKDKIIMGAERHTMVMSEDEKKLTAYHEAGHCIVGRLVPGQDPVYKVSIVPRGRALGVTMFLPERDQYSASREKLESQISVAYGGRLAEELIFGTQKVTTGASNDIERATELARNMVTQWGLSEKMGPLAYSQDQGQPFLGAGMSQSNDVSEETAARIDEEIRKLIDRNYDRAERLLKENMSILHAMAAALMEWETIDRLQIDDLMEGRKPRPPKDLGDSKTATSSTAASDAESPPVNTEPVPDDAAARSEHSD